MKLMNRSVGARRWLPVLVAAAVCGLSAEPALSHSSQSQGSKSHSHKSHLAKHSYKHNHWHHAHKPRHHHKPPPPPPPLPGNPQDGRCGYAIGTGTYANWGSGYQGWVDVKNMGGAVGTTFSVLLDVGNTRVVDGYQATFTATSDGYLVEAPSYLKHQKIKPGHAYRFGFIGQGRYSGHSGHVLSVNGVKCDTVAPTVELGALPGFVTQAGTLTLTATASDNVTVRKVVFQRDGQVIGEDKTAPYSLDVPLSEAANGRHTFTAVAYDPSGNQVSDSDSTLIAIDNRFLGTAPAAPVDYEDLLTYFNQLTPGNAGKWGSVEAVRDVMNWDDLDEAYFFAESAGIPFKLHTLVWGQQQPAWLSSLSPAEQLEELEEWMAALAERYPNLPLIDVVNEPMHAPPAYAEALGGAGATGYDWVLNAFTLARTYFPHSELLLNEYQVLIFRQFTEDYLQIINALQEEGLIDGIGEQGHFLERADVAEVASNLELLAATGLPIYISEFDVDFEDDTRHANVFKDLFSVFWDHPSVLGVTHWGHLEGSTWRTNAYLIRQDKSERPALQWLNCYIAEGSDCSVPPYVPQPWVGDEFGVTLEAELYDEAQGVLALGDVVAYTDDSDWIGFSTVNLDDTWDTLSVTYAKGSPEVGTISVHLDSLENDPVAEVVLEPTAGWGSNETVEVPWPSVGGAHAVYFRFNNTFGVANLDSIRIGKEPVVDTGVELIANGEFESNTNGWYTWNGAVSVSSDRAHGGTHSLLVSGGSGTGPAATSLMGLAQPGVTYTVSFWVSVGGSSPSQVNLTQALNCGGSTTYSWIANDNAVPTDGWVQLTGSLAIPASCDLQGLQVYAEGSGAGVPLYIDSVSIKGPPATAPQNLIANGDFESDVSGWFSWNGSVSSSAAKAQKGARSLLVSGGSGTGPAATTLSDIQAGATYNVSFWVSVGNVASSQVNVTRALTCGGSTSYSWVANNGAVASDAWTELAGSFTVPADCASPGLMLYAEGGGASVDLYVDNVVVTKAP